MKKVICRSLPAAMSALLALLAVQVAQAQTVTPSLMWEDVAPSEGSVSALGVPFSDAGPRGEDAVWLYDLSNASESTEIVTRLASDSSALCVDGRNILSYQWVADSLFVTGFENRMVRMTYDQPVVLLPCPFAFGDSVASHFSGHGVYGGRVHMLIDGECYTVADGVGVLTDGSDTLYNVIRLHHHREYAKLVCGTDSASELPDRRADGISEDVYTWHVAGVSHPVMESVVRSALHDGGETLLCQAARLLLDQDLLSLLTSDAESAADGDAASASEDFPVDYAASYDPASGAITIELGPTDHPVSVSVDAYDFMGNLLGSASFNTKIGIQEQKNVKLLREPIKNVVILSVKADGVQHSSKINTNCQ